VTTPPRILVVEHSHSVGELLTCALEQEGCTAVLARNGRQGVELARRLRPDLIAVDIGQACLGGADLIPWLRADPATSDIPIIALSAPAGALEASLSTQVTRAFGEPYYPAEVVAAVLQTLDELKAPTMVRPAIRR
jgi:CheY-like chemotaxis protein